jgi:hypothetical protein
VLGSTCCIEFTTPEGRAKALTQIRRHSIDGLGVAEVVVVPEIETTPDGIAHELRAAYDLGESAG